MTITIEKLRIQIQKARAQLISSVEAWLNTEQGFTQDDKNKWLDAVKSLTSEEMQRKLQASNFPLQRLDQITRVPEVEVIVNDEAQDPELPVPVKEPIDLTRRTYVISPKLENPTLSKLCQLTTLFEQLHHLEELLTPFDLPIPFDDIRLAHAMACSITQEWRFVKKGVNTVAYYTSRAKDVHEQLKRAQAECLNSFQLLEAPLENKLLQFAETLSFFAESLTQAYSLVIDDRILVELWAFTTFRIRAYLPWQDMINQLTTQLFEANGFHHPNLNTLLVNGDSISGIIESVDNQTKKPFTALREEYQLLSNTAEVELQAVCEKLKYMATSINVQQQIGLRRAVIMGTQGLGFFSFFQNLQAIQKASDASLLLDDKTYEESGKSASFSQ